MELCKILEDFNRTKERIRSNARFKTPLSQTYDGLNMAIAYSDVMEYVVKHLFDLTVEKLGSESKSGIAAFLYGSPGRREMVCESDLDMMLVYKNNSQKYQEFKDKFRELVAPFKFCKIDLPEWGTLDEARIFAERSITEGNQVLESRFVCGDESIREQIEKAQKEFGGSERMIRNIVFV